MLLDPEELTPTRIVAELDKHIIGQGQAKRAVAIALRNRWRRMQVIDKDLAMEINPKNILMIGPTGVGKTEISRRLARLVSAPFIKVEATKFTEVGYVGRDVDSIIRDLTEVSYDMCRDRMALAVNEVAYRIARERLLDALNLSGEERSIFEVKLRAGEFDHNKEVEIEVAPPSPLDAIHDMNIPGMEGFAKQLGTIMQGSSMAAAKQKRKLHIDVALKVFAEEEIDKRIDENELGNETLTCIENSGIVFIDEFDKIASGERSSGIDVSRQGVQRDLLPLIEGTTVATRLGIVSTDHILFIASGSFHYSSPNDLIPELQGRLPIRVELAPLTVADFASILNGTDACLIRQYEALLDTEGLTISFTPAAVRKIAEHAYRLNETEENVGARRLHELMESLLEDISFKADSMGGRKKKFTDKDIEKMLSKSRSGSTNPRFIL